MTIRCLPRARADAPVPPRAAGRARRALLFIATVVATPAAAQQPAVDSARADTLAPPRRLERVTVTAIRAGGVAPISQTTIPKAAVERRAFGQDIPHLLTGAAPSLWSYTETGSYWGYGYLRLRGIDQSRINISLDGIPLNDPEDQALYFTNFPDLAASLGSVQVQRGVGTSAGGTAAFAGSVNLESTPLATTTRGGRLELGGGSFDTRRASAQLASGLVGGRFAASLRLSAIGTDGYRRHSGVEGRSAFLAAGWFGDRDIVKLTATAGLFRDTMAYLAASERELAADRRVNPLPPTARDAFGQQVAALSYTRLLGSAGSIATTVYRISAGGDYDVEIDPDLWNFALDFRWNGVTSTWTLERPGLRLDAGVNANDYARDHHAYVRPALDAPVYFNTGHKRDASAFAKASWTAGALTLFGDVQGRWAEFRYVPSARSGIDGQRIDWRFLNPRLGASWQAARPVRLYASYGVTRREPTRSDMLAGFDDLDTSSVAFVGRFDRVRPERVGDLEAGVVVERRGARLAANVFDMRFRDEIAPIGALSYLGSPLRKNVSRSARRGVELDASWQPSSRVELGLLGTVMRGHIDEYTDDASGATFTDVEPLLTPRVSLTHRTSVAATHTLRLSLDGRYTGRSFLANTGDARFVLPASYLLDAGAELALGRHALVVHANNLLDSHRFASGYTDGAESYYYPLPPRNLLVTVRVGF